MTNDEQKLRDFRWNILLAWSQGGAHNLAIVVARMVAGQELDVERIVEEDAPRSPVISPYAEPRCEICKFCLAPGRCHRFPPQAVTINEPRADDYTIYVFPRVQYDDWCGEFQLDQAAVDRIEASTKETKP